jgi:hypothetical protein
MVEIACQYNSDQLKLEIFILLKDHDTKLQVELQRRRDIKKNKFLILVLI